MSDLSRLQSLAEAVEWKIECGIGNYVLTTNMGTSIHSSLTPIRERLEQEYRKLAEQSKYQMDILEATGYLCNMKDYRATHFTRIADELSVPEEPTMDVWEGRARDIIIDERCLADGVERLRGIVVQLCHDLYEQKEKA